MATGASGLEVIGQTGQVLQGYGVMIQNASELHGTLHMKRSCLFWDQRGRENHSTQPLWFRHVLLEPTRPLIFRKNKVVLQEARVKMYKGE